MQRFVLAWGIVELPDERLAHIKTFHPDAIRYLNLIQRSLHSPHGIALSKYDPAVRIFYHQLPRRKTYLAVVVKIGERNFILTAYLTNKIKHKRL